MNNLLNTTLSASLTLIFTASYSSVVNANACSVKSVVQDKCTILLNNPSANRTLNKFIGDMHSSCNKHDRAYNTLGADRGAADRRLQRDLRKDCLDNPFTASICLPAVEAGVAFVRSKGADIYQARQNEMLAHVKNVNSRMGADQCVATPAQQGFIDAGLLLVIENKFKSIVGRPPTAYERYEMLSRYIPSGGHNGSTFINSITSYAYNRRGINAPVITSVSFYESALDVYSYTWQPHVLNSAYAQYDWRVNLGRKTTPKYVFTNNSRYDSSNTMNGYLKVSRSKDERDVTFIYKSFTSQGWCSSSREEACQVPW